MENSKVVKLRCLTSVPFRTAVGGSCDCPAQLILGLVENRLNPDAVRRQRLFGRLL